MKYTYKIKDVKGDGSCFYRSVYGAAKASKLLKKMTKCFGVGVGVGVGAGDGAGDIDEDDFVELVRACMSQRIRDGNDFGIIHDMFMSFKEYDSKTYKAILVGMPAWFVKSFPKKPRDEMQFRMKIAEKIRLKSSWASEIDITLFQKIVASCSSGRRVLKVVVLNSTPTRFSPRKNCIYVINRGEVHYMYIHVREKKECPDGKILNERTIRCVKENGNVGKKIQEEKYGKKCKDGKVLNPKTKRCVDKNGRIGRNIVSVSE